MLHRTASTRASGFTLIELLIVIAIIGVLSAVVLSALNSARGKGTDAAIKSSLDNGRSQAELFYDSNSNNYVITAGGTTDVCSATASVNGVKGLYSFMQSAQQAYGPGLTLNSNLSTGGASSKITCHASAALGWALEAPLKNTTGFYCVDSTGKATTTTTGTSNLTSGDYAC